MHSEESKKKSVFLRESRAYIICGLLMLLAGSGLLLVCKMTAQPLTGTLAAYAGGAVVLFGNGLIIYGLLIYAGSKEEG